jgi:UDP-3-O-[3-hydroxymyristoyl] glucosamine N-acyltransferase
VSPLTSFKLSELANILEAELDGNPDTEIFGLSSLDLASEEDISFISRESFIPQLQSTNAAAIICSKALSDHYKGNKLISDDPYLLYAKCSSLFKSKPLQNPGISKLASVDSSASVADSAVISNFVSVSKNSIIEDDVILMPGVFIGNDTVVRKGTIIHSNASIYESIEIGEGCIIHSGVVIGSDGLGFAKESNQWVKIEHLGKVLIGNNVELGSNTTIDRGSVGDTVLGDNIKIDNLVHIAHNVSIGSGSAIAANSAIAGSTKIGKNCTLAGCTALVDNIQIVDEVHITAKSLITKSIKESGIYSSGTPFMKNSDWKKNAVGFKKLHKLSKL